MRVFGLDIRRIPPAAKPPAADDAREVMDATILLLRAYTGRAWSRRRSPLPARRWNSAMALLKAAGVVSDTGTIDCTYVEAIGRLWLWHVNQTQLRNAGRYVPAKGK